MTPLRTIAVGFDTSPDSEAAVRWAIDLARDSGADVVLVHAVGLRAHVERDAIDAELKRAVQRLSEESGLDPRRIRLHVDNGDPCSVMMRATEPPIGADVLVVGSRGQGAHAGLLLGSTSLELAERSTVPIVIVPHGRAG